MEQKYLSYEDYEYVNFSELEGKTLTKITRESEYTWYNEVIEFFTATGEHYVMTHQQDCCESVYVESINGDLEDLLNTPITLAEESTSSEYQPWEDALVPDEDGYIYENSFTWTFYKLATVKGYVDIRWYGSSNGYYSESASLLKINK